MTTVRDDSSIKLFQLGTTDGLYVEVNLNKLVEKVYISPTADKWFEDLVKSVASKYMLDKSVVRSSLADDPIF